MRKLATKHTGRQAAHRRNSTLSWAAALSVVVLANVGCTSLSKVDRSRRTHPGAAVTNSKPHTTPYVQPAVAPAADPDSPAAAPDSPAVVTASYGQQCTQCNTSVSQGYCACSQNGSFGVSGSYEVAGDASCGTGDCGCGPVCQTPGRCKPNAQEYIFDGGDEHARVVVQKDWSAKGVNPTDTVAYYETAGGDICVRPSNRVPIYAPRFGAIRQVRGVQLSELAVGTHRILAPVAPGKLEDAELAGNMIQPIAPQGGAQVDALDAFQKNAGGIPIEHVLAWKGMSEARVPHEAIDFFRTGELSEVQIPVIGRILEGARTWYTNESLAVMLDGQSAVVMKDAKFAKEITVYETEDKCSLRICKAASHTIAASGDIISFTIRFDNVGPRPIKKTVILDSLSPRLEYIEGSAQASVDADFTSTPNDVGSSLLKWQLTSDLAPSSGGVISFDCLVR